MYSGEGSNILREARQGSPEALEVLFERYGRRLHGLIRLRLGAKLRRQLESRDILQATLLKAFQGIDRFDGSGSGPLMAWLGAIAQAEICDQAEFHGRRKRDADLNTSLDGKAHRLAQSVRTEVSRIQLQEDLLRLERAIEALAEHHRELILLRSFEELSFKEIGRRLNKSSEASRKLFGRAKAALTMKMREAP